MRLEKGSRETREKRLYNLNDKLIRLLNRLTTKKQMRMAIIALKNEFRDVKKSGQQLGELTLELFEFNENLRKILSNDDINEKDKAQAIRVLMAINDSKVESTLNRIE